MTDIITHNQIMVEIKGSLNHILHSLTELSTRINKPPHTPPVQPINTQAPLSLPPPPNPTTPSSISPSKPTLPSSYPIKRLTYSEMQQLRDQGLCLNCNKVETPSHRCLIQRILLVLPDEDPNIEQQPMKLFEPVDLKAPQFQSTALNSSVARKMDTDITHHSLHTKTVHILGFPYDNSFPLSMAVVNGENIMSNGLCSKDYILFLRSLVECMIKMTERKVFKFDPGGQSDAEGVFEMRSIHSDAHLMTLRTRSISSGW